MSDSEVRRLDEPLGEWYTDFVRTASRMARRAGEKFQHHVSVSMDSMPEERSMTNIYWNWRGWLKEGLLDAITLKNFYSSNNFFNEVMDAADAQGVETLFCPYLNRILSGSASWADQLAELMRSVSANGLHGIILYQSAAFLQANQQGDVVLKFPQLRQVLRS